MTDSNMWIEKYKPLKIVDLITNTSSVTAIYEWINSYENVKKKALKTFNKKKVKSTKNIVSNKIAIKKNKKNNFKSCMLITGGHGTGKTITLEVILKNLNFNILNFNIGILKSEKNINEIINKLMVNILVRMNGDKMKKTAIIIDELESITAKAEKVCIMSLQKTNDINWYCPIIFISNGQHNKLLSDIRKATYEVKFYPPLPQDMKKILIKIAINENISIKNDDVINKIINNSQNDIRRLIFILEDIKKQYDNKLINVEIMDNYSFMSNKKDIIIDLYKATDEILYKYNNIDTCLKLFETEKILLPLMIHQNYIQSVLANYKNNDEKYTLIQKISESLSIGDVIENHIYGDQNWEMQEIHGFYTCVAPSYYLCKNLNNKYNKINLTFATDLNKTSIKKINKKNIINADKCFKNMNINDYIYINKIVKKLIINNSIKECCELLKNLNIQIEQIDSLLKIDKIKSSKLVITTKQRDEFIEYLK